MQLQEHNLRKTKIIAGLDEAGRGCLAGPVVAAAVILRPGFHHPCLNDSKKMKPTDRIVLKKIIEDTALAYGVAFVPPERIDEINILWASIEAMHQAIEQLEVVPEHLLIDGNRFIPFPDISHECVVKGDSRFLSIAAASVLAKTYRDEYMILQHKNYPVYGWDNNKGYPTRQHRIGLIKHGSCSLHRNSFRLLTK